MRRMRTGLVVTVVALCALAVALPAPAAKPVAAKACGSDAQVDSYTGERSYLREYTRRRGISCAGAKAVFAAAQRAHHAYACGREVVHHGGWTIRHSGPTVALSSRYVDGSRTFEVTEQGSC
jgi:hypothetical protein